LIEKLYSPHDFPLEVKVDLYPIVLLLEFSFLNPKLIAQLLEGEISASEMC